MSDELPVEGRPYGWRQVTGGALRFFGKEAMREVRELVQGDPDYTWSIPSGWPAPFWLDVYPRNPDAQNRLLEIIDG